MRSFVRGRWVAAVLAASLAVAAGCGGGGDGGSSAAAGGPSKKVTLTFWNGFTGPDRPALEELVKRFNASQDKVTINMTVMPWDVFFQKLLPAYAAKKGPDIAAMDTVQLPQYADKGVFADLEDLYGDSSFPADQLVQSATDATKWDDKHYAVPMNFTTLLLYWNKDMFKQAGLDPQTPPATWQEWQDAAKKLTIDKNGDGKPEQYGLALADHETIPMWPILVWGNGGDVVKDGNEAMLDDPKTIEAVTTWSDLIKNDHISPIGLGGADADKLFQSKKAAMEVVGPWMTTGFKDAGIDFGLGMVPAGPEQQVTLGTSVAMALSAQSAADGDKKAAAYQWFKYWNSAESQAYWAVHSGFPPTRTDIPAEKLSENPWVAEFGKYADKSQFYLTGVKDYAKVNTDVWEPTIQKIENGRGSADQLLKDADGKIQQVLDSSR
jgi:multiple sugar transport system substrate-binding protein